MTTNPCGQPHYRYTESVCTEPAGHYVRDRDPHAGPLIIDGRQCGGLAWDEPEEQPVTDRIPLDHLTSDALDALYAENDRLTAELADYDRRVERLDEQLSDLRAQLALALEREDSLNCGYDHGFASTYGLDAETDGFVDAVLAAVQPHLEQQKQRADTAEAKVRDYENRITWHTTCQSCARVLDSGIRETERAERAEAALAHIARLADEHPAGIDTALVLEALDRVEPAPNPPGSTCEQLPAEILALLPTHPYLSTACQTADAVACTAVRGLPQYDELRAHAERLHGRCRLNHKFTGQLCTCGCHPTPADGPA